MYGTGWDDKPAKIQTDARLAWDQRNLYVGIRCEKPTEKDSVHILLGPKPGGDTIYRLVVKADGQVKRKGWGATKKFSAEVTSSVRLKDDHRIVEVQLPWTGFDIESPGPGRVLKLNFGRERMEGIQKQETEWSHTRGYMNDSTVLYGDLRLVK